MRLTALATSLAVMAGLTMGAPLPAAAAEPDAAPPDAKIASDLKDRFDEEPVADFWITFNANADLAPAKEITDWDERGQFVYDALEKSAKASEAAVCDRTRGSGREVHVLPARQRRARQGRHRRTSRSTSPRWDRSPRSTRRRRSRSSNPWRRRRRLTRPSAPTPRPQARRASTRGAWTPSAPPRPGHGRHRRRHHGGQPRLGRPVRPRGAGGEVPRHEADGTFDHDYNWMATRTTCSDAPCDDNGHGTHTMGTMVGDDGDQSRRRRPGRATGSRPTAAAADPGRESLLASGWWLLAPTDLHGQQPGSLQAPSRHQQLVGPGHRARLPHLLQRHRRGLDGCRASSASGRRATPRRTRPVTPSPRRGGPGRLLRRRLRRRAATWRPSRARARVRDGQIKPEISAPGRGRPLVVPRQQYVEMSGTSMAAPHVAGAVADLWSYDPTLIGQVEETRRLLGESAVDVDNTSCGGTADFNNMYGEGRLDLARLLELAPRQGGTLTGVVTANGEPVVGAEVTISGPFTRSVGTDEAGRFSMNLPVGDYRLSTKVFGYLPATAEVAIALGRGVLRRPPAHRRPAARHPRHGGRRGRRRRPERRRLGQGHAAGRRPHGRRRRVHDRRRARGRVRHRRHAQRVLLAHVRPADGRR